jgi:hypothetical protein
MTISHGLLWSERPDCLATFGPFAYPTITEVGIEYLSIGMSAVRLSYLWAFDCFVLPQSIRSLLTARGRALPAGGGVKTRDARVA